MPTPVPIAASGNLVPLYAVYLAVSIGLTIWLATTLHRNGKTFLHDVFEDQPEMGDALNRLLVVGFFMLNLGYAFLILRAEPTATNEAAVQLLVNRLGLLLVSLGLIHFVNMAVFWRIRARQTAEQLPPPIPPGRRGAATPPRPPAPPAGVPPATVPAGVGPGGNADRPGAPEFPAAPSPVPPGAQWADPRWADPRWAGR